MNQETKRRDLARDTRNDRVGEVMAEPGQASRKNYFLRPVGGGREYEVPREYVEIIERAEAGA